MLPRLHRLTRRTDFTEVLRRGRRASRPLLTLHAELPADGVPPDRPVRAGLVVSKAVGGSVVRHRVARRLRHLLRGRLERVPPGTRLVVRAAPPSATAGSAALAADLDAGLDLVLRAGRRGRGSGGRSAPSAPRRAGEAP